MTATVAPIRPPVSDAARMSPRTRSLAAMGWTIIRLGYDPRYLTDLDPLFAEIAAVMAAELQAFALPLP